MSKEAVGREWEWEPGGGEAMAAAAGAGRRAAVRARCPRRLPVCRAPRSTLAILAFVYCWTRALQLFPVLHRDLPQCCSFQ